MLVGSLRKPTIGRLLAGLFGIAGCVAVAGPPAFAADSQPIVLAQAQSGSGVSAPQPPPAAGNAGMRVHIDPKTGAILRQPAPGSVPLTLTPMDQNAMSTSHEGLVEVPNPVPGGGVKLDLQGRFQSPLIATIGPDGKVTVQHPGEPAEPLNQHQ
jgi:hypothetical protein